MERKWTEAQIAAIEAKNKKILVSAAAGSGKTATLIERIIRSITVDIPRMDISRMLVVTFTRAAASELRLRVMKALNDAIRKNPSDTYLRRQLLLLETADISTIDSFCLNVMQSEFQHSGIDGEFRIGDENELALIRSRAMDEAIETVLKTNPSREDGKIYEFFSVLGGPRKDKGLAEKLLNIYEELMNTPEGIEYIRIYSESLIKDSEAGDVNERAKSVILSETALLFEHIRYMLEGYISVANTDEAMKKSYGNAMASDADFCKCILEAASDGNYFKIRKLLQDHVFPKLAPMKAANKTPASESFVSDRSSYKKMIAELIEKYYVWSGEDIRLINSKSADFLSVLYSVLLEYEKLSTEAKRRKHLMEFNDLKRGVFNLFVSADGSPTELAYEYSSKYDIIYIDEYQDVDPIQDKIFSALSVNSKLYTVGDIKQSIYGFRGSDPTIFGRLRREYPVYDPNADTDTSAAIYMSNNFRCSKPIISAANHICSYLFKITDKCFGSVGYTDGDDLVFSKDKIRSAPVEFTVCEPYDTEDEKEDDSAKYRAEVAYIANKISLMMGNETKEDSSPFSYSDFAVLCDSNRQVRIVCELLSSYSVPCDDAPVENFFDSPEIQLVRSLLAAIDNPLRDVPLASVLISPIFGFNDSEITEIRAAFPETTLYESVSAYAEDGFGELRAKCILVKNRLSAYSRTAQIKPVDEFISYLWNRLDINAVASFEANDKKSPEMRLSNLTKLYDYATGYNAGIYRTLHDFLAYIDELIESETFSLALPYSADSSNKVHVLTIHKSKGLEFPVCFIFGTGFSNAGRQNDSDIVFEESVGFCFNPAANKGLVRIRSPYREAALSRQKEKQRLEKIRLIYVALTRAKERLIISATATRDFNRMIESLGGYTPSIYPYVDIRSAYRTLHSKLYAEWILLSCPKFGSDGILLSDYSTSEAEMTGTSNKKETTKEKTSEIDFSEKELFKRFEFRYSSAAADIPAKLAVSALSPSVLDENPVYGEEPEDRALSFEDIPQFITGEKAKATDRGTANHLFLQFCDFNECERYGIDHEIKRLTDKGFILSEHAALISKHQIERFFSSRFYSQIKNAKKIYREQRFNIPLPAHLFSEISSQRAELRKHYILVQGVIDIIIETEDGKIILADYKTDFVPEEIRNDETAVKRFFNERYASQLSYYALAIKRLFSEYPEKIIIFSLSLGKETDVDFDPSSFM